MCVFILGYSDVFNIHLTELGENVLYSDKYPLTLKVWSSPPEVQARGLKRNRSWSVCCPWRFSPPGWRRGSRALRLDRTQVPKQTLSRPWHMLLTPPYPPGRTRSQFVLLFFHPTLSNPPTISINLHPQMHQSHWGASISSSFHPCSNPPPQVQTTVTQWPPTLFRASLSPLSNQNLFYRKTLPLSTGTLPETSALFIPLRTNSKQFHISKSPWCGPSF